MEYASWEGMPLRKQRLVIDQVAERYTQEKMKGLESELLQVKGERDKLKEQNDYDERVHESKLADYEQTFHRLQKEIDSLKEALKVTFGKNLSL